MQLWILGQLEQARLPVEVFFIEIFQQPGARQFAVGKSQQSSRQVRSDTKRKTPDNAIANIELGKRKQLVRRRFELAGRSGIASPTILPPETDVMWVTFDKRLESRRKRMSPS